MDVMCIRLLITVKLGYNRPVLSSHRLKQPVFKVPFFRSFKRCGYRSSRHQGVSPPTNSPPRDHLATNHLATKQSLLTTKHNKNESTVCRGELTAQKNFFCTCLFKSYDVNMSVNWYDKCSLARELESWRTRQRSYNLRTFAQKFSTR